jgi:perosamine synthetase
LIGRHQLPVSSTITAHALVRALGARAHERAALAAELRQAFGASEVVLVDSGTSALAMALRASTSEGGVVALPAYACVDIGAVAIFARLRVRLYDVDPVTLSADLDSVSRVLEAGTDTIVVSHLYGYPADVPAVTALATAHGAAVIEDAAQSAWGSLRGKRLGGFGPLAVLSFGRGKGMTGGGGGALLAIGERAPDALTADGTQVAAPASSLRTLAITMAQWALGRPSLYALPSAVPSLHLGETIYHPAHDPRSITSASAVLVRAALARADRDLAVRRRNAEVLELAARNSHDVTAISPLADAEPGYLRFPVRLADTRIRDREQPTLGIVHGYPDTLAELAELRSSLIGNEPLPGARELQRSIVTLPTHSLMSEKDLMKVCSWMG